MKVFKALVASLVIVGLAGSVAVAGENCSASKKTAQKAGYSCSAKATQAKAGKSCASKATQASAGYSCGAKATQASLGSCSAALKAGLCATGDAGACPTGEGGCCAMNVIYKVSVDGTLKHTFDAEKAAKWANGGEIQYVAAGTVYDTEAEAKMAMTKAIYTNLEKMTTVQYVVGDQAMHCGVSASKKAGESGKKVLYRVAARDFESKEKADAFLGKIHSIMASLKMVDAEGNPVEGCAVGHTKSHPSCEGKAFKVGDQTIDDPVDANLTLAQQRLQAILSLDA